MGHTYEEIMDILDVFLLIIKLIDFLYNVYYLTKI